MALVDEADAAENLQAAFSKLSPGGKRIAGLFAVRLNIDPVVAQLKAVEATDSKQLRRIGLELRAAGDALVILAKL